MPGSGALRLTFPITQCGIIQCEFFHYIIAMKWAAGLLLFLGPIRLRNGALERAGWESLRSAI